VSESPWARESSRRKGAPPSGRIIEIITVALLALATVGSAWSAFQVSRWNGVETDEARTSASFRIDASREYALATQTVAYDAASVSQYAQAVSTDNANLQLFIRETIVRPRFLPILDSWEAQIAEGELPTNLLQNQEYLDELLEPSRDLDAQALAATVASEEAGDTADDYIRLTLFFASALFFAGITASFRTRLPKLLLIVAAGATLAVAGALLVSYPVA
jgi:ABC-type Fe3+-siderophore transport system permease subunit